MRRDQTSAHPDEADAGLDFELDLEGGETIPVQVDLRSKVKERRPKRGEQDPVAAAEAALKRMETKFGGWIRDETEALTKAWRTAEAQGFADPARSDLFRAAHDVKGQAATLGFPFAGRIAGSLCLLLDHAGPAERLPPVLVQHHVQAVRAIVAENARDDVNDTARRLAERLEEVTGDYLASLGVKAA